MQTIRIPVRELHEIEFTSVCNLACVYCPHPQLQRPKRHMTQETFACVLNHLEWLCKEGTQGEVSLTGIGETTLHPMFEHMTRSVRQVVGSRRRIVMSTNGLTMTKDLSEFLALWKVDVYVSLHRPEMAGRALQLLREAGCRHGHNHAFVDSALDWAGQVEWQNTAPRGVCQYLQQSWVAVREDGMINTCCMDAHSKHPLGSVLDPIGSLTTTMTALCSGCHLVVPQHMKQKELAHG